jgi:hypothetical protein
VNTISKPLAFAQRNCNMQTGRKKLDYKVCICYIKEKTVFNVRMLWINGHLETYKYGILSQFSEKSTNLYTNTLHDRLAVAPPQGYLDTLGI